MVHDIFIRPEAEADLLDAFNWYQDKRVGLGHDFKLCVDEVLSRISRNPDIFPQVYSQIRRALKNPLPPSATITVFIPGV